MRKFLLYLQSKWLRGLFTHNDLCARLREDFAVPRERPATADARGERSTRSFQETGEDFQSRYSKFAHVIGKLKQLRNTQDLVSLYDKCDVAYTTVIKDLKCNADSKYQFVKETNLPKILPHSMSFTKAP